MVYSPEFLELFDHVPNPVIIPPKFLLAETIDSMTFAPKIYTYFFLLIYYSNTQETLVILWPDLGHGQIP